MQTLDNLIIEYGVTVQRDTIVSPGAFERENPSILYWHRAMLDGDGVTVYDCGPCSECGIDCNQCDGLIVGTQFAIGPDDRDAICLPTDANYAVLRTDDNGFWYLDYNHEPIDEYEEQPDASCDQCVAAMINGRYCHELGCPNTHKIKVDGDWTEPDADEDYEDEDDC